MHKFLINQNIDENILFYFLIIFKDKYYKLIFLTFKKNQKLSHKHHSQTSTLLTN